MAKGDDIVRRKKNKLHRKKLRNDSSSSSLSARVTSLIAAKKRRKSGKRRQCLGMCFSLPTPEDPFNERNGKPDVGHKKPKQPAGSQATGETSTKLKSDEQRKRPTGQNQNDIDHPQAKRLKVKNVDNTQQTSNDRKLWEENSTKDEVTAEWEGSDLENSGCPSKFLFLCLNSIQDAFVGNGQLDQEHDKPLFVYSWGAEFWKCFSMGKDVLETNGASPNMQQIAWMASSAADSIARKEKDDEYITCPFLLYLVPSQERAAQVRAVCKPLKAMGIHTVSLHPGAAVEHQIHGLKSCEPEFLIATPERLWELVSSKALDISGVSLLVVDALDTLSNELEVVTQIRQCIPRNSHTIVFQGSSSSSGSSLIRQPFRKLSAEYHREL